VAFLIQDLIFFKVVRDYIHCLKSIAKKPAGSFYYKQSYGFPGSQIDPDFFFKSVADPDPGSDAFDPWIRIRDEQPGS
jgi:hypothetical protein